MRTITNAFSLNMVKSFPCQVSVWEISLADAISYSKTAVSAVGHADTASVFTSVLGTDVPFNRISLSVGSGDTLLVGQYMGQRLPEGCTTLPEGATIKWLLVNII